MMILKALLFINGFALLIAGIIIFMDRVVNNYGKCKITINDDKEFTEDGGKSLLRMLFENKYFIPSACGGKGTCGYCKLKVTEGGGDALPTETLILTPKEQSQQFRLACQLKVKNDLKIEIPPEYLEIQEFKGEVILTELVTSDIKRVRIKLLEPKKMTYKPGQYVQIRIPTDAGIEFRAYSMASNPDQTDEIEVNVKLIPDGIGSTYVHSKSVGSKIEFSGPYGDFFLKTDSQNDIVCVAGGVGLAPLKSIVSYWEAHKPDRHIYLFYGARKEIDLYDHDYFTRLDKQFEKFHYHPGLSDADQTWEGAKGFIHTVMDNVMEPGSGEHSEAYLCGPPIMINAVTETLKSKGLTEERIWYDKF